MSITDEDLQMERKGDKDLEKLQKWKKRSMPEKRRCFNMGYATLSEPVAVKKRLAAVAKKSLEVKAEQKEE